MRNYSIKFNQRIKKILKNKGNLRTSQEFKYLNIESFRERKKKTKGRKLLRINIRNVFKSKGQEFIVCKSSLKAQINE